MTEITAPIEAGKDLREEIQFHCLSVCLSVAADH